MSNENEYERDLIIDEHDLKGEWLRQSSLYMKYAKQYAIAQAELKRSKQNRDVVRAEISNRIRNEHTKITEKAIETMVIVSPEYINVYSDYADKIEESEILRGAVEAFNHRKKALEELVRLFFGGYFSEPHEDRDQGQDFKNDAIDAASKKHTDKLNQKKKIKKKER